MTLQRFRELFAAGIRMCHPPRRGRATTDAAAETGSAAGETELAALRQPPPNAARAGHARRKRRDQSSRNRSGDTAKTQPTDPHDPNSDTLATAPPSLRSAAGAGRSDTTLVVTATDDLSGIRASPHAHQPEWQSRAGFRQQREGETMRYTSRIHIPKKRRRGSGR